MDTSSGEFYGVEVYGICGLPVELRSPTELGLSLIARADAGLTALVPLPQGNPALAMNLREKIGDCRVLNLTYDDAYVGNSASYILRSPCTTVDLTGLQPAPVISAYLKEKIDPLIATDMAQNAIFFCDHTADPSNFRQVLDGVNYSEDKWTMVCLQPGVYYGGYRIGNATNLILWSLGGRGAAKFQNNMSSSGQHPANAGLEIWTSRNVFIDGVDFDNLHPWTHPNRDAGEDDGTYVSRALQVAYSKGVTVARSTITSLGKQTAQIAAIDFTRLKDVNIMGGYFVIEYDYGSLLVEDAYLQQDLAANQHYDTHPLLTGYKASLVLKNTRAARLSGNDFLGLTADPAEYAQYIHNISFTAMAYDAWLAMYYESSGYAGSHVILSGSYPSGVADFGVHCDGQLPACGDRSWHQVFHQ